MKKTKWIPRDLAVENTGQMICLEASIDPHLPTECLPFFTIQALSAILLAGEDAE
jgi:hypothetical protein